MGRLDGGGPARIYLARSHRGRAVVVKVPRPEALGSETVRRRLASGTGAASSVEHRFLAPVVQSDAFGEPPWVATAYTPGLTLAEVVRRFGPLPAHSVRALGAGLAEGLAAVHGAGLAHGGLTPANVLLTADGPRLLDLGSSLSGVLGSTDEWTGFMAPEHIENGHMGPAADIFALGALLCYAVAGTSPYGEGSAQVVLYRVVHADPDLDAVPEGLRRAVESCLDRDPARRPSAADAGAGLAEVRDRAAFREWLPAAVALGMLREAAEVLGRESEAAWRPARAHPSPAAGTVGSARGTGPHVRPDTKPEASTGEAPAEEVPRRPAHPLRRLTRRQLLAAGGGVVLAAGGAALGVRSALRGRQPDHARWRYDAGSSVYGPLQVAADAGVVLFVDWNHSLHAVDMATGARRWRRGPAHEAGDRPATARGLVLACMDGKLYAIDARNGDFAWSVPGVGNGEVTADARQAYVTTYESDELVAVDLDTRKVRYRRRADEGFSRGATVSGDVLLVGIGGSAYCLESATGQVRWSQDAGSGTAAAPVAADGLVWLGTSIGDMFAFDLATGRVRHRTLLSGGTYGDGRSRVAVHRGIAVVGTTDSKVYGVDTTSGRVRWSHLTEGDPEFGGVESSPVIAGDTVFIGSGGHYLDALDLTSGTLRWRFRTLKVVDSSPAVHGGLVFFGSYDHGVYAVDRRTGRG
ncbi:PQQ-binding-like beta-propeller repeat protein [Streptomyces fuscichromogenes]|uniref:serine/threonine-protein kinase n=1 Tax=Streptomyces fuscichromogenes TaxID=1324013 RepID=UPI0037F9A46F